MHFRCIFLDCDHDESNPTSYYSGKRVQWLRQISLKTALDFSDYECSDAKMQRKDMSIESSSSHSRKSREILVVEVKAAVTENFKCWSIWNNVIGFFSENSESKTLKKQMKKQFWKDSYPWIAKHLLENLLKEIKNSLFDNIGSQNRKKLMHLPLSEIFWSAGLQEQNQTEILNQKSSNKLESLLTVLWKSEICNFAGIWVTLLRRNKSKNSFRNNRIIGDFVDKVFEWRSPFEYNGAIRGFPNEFLLEGDMSVVTDKDVCERQDKSVLLFLIFSEMSGVS